MERNGTPAYRLVVIMNQRFLLRHEPHSTKRHEQRSVTMKRSLWPHQQTTNIHFLAELILPIEIEMFHSRGLLAHSCMHRDCKGHQPNEFSSNAWDGICQRSQLNSSAKTFGDISSSVENSFLNISVLRSTSPPTPRQSSSQERERQRTEIETER
jgi:hypothetical protein